MKRNITFCPFAAEDTRLMTSQKPDSSKEIARLVLKKLQE